MTDKPSIIFTNLIFWYIFRILQNIVFCFHYCKLRYHFFQVTKVDIHARKVNEKVFIFVSRGAIIYRV